MPNINSMHLKTKVSLKYHCRFHGNLVAVALKYAADACCPNET